jgi:hypothetical protein
LEDEGFNAQGAAILAILAWHSREKAATGRYKTEEHNQEWLCH